MIVKSAAGNVKLDPTFSFSGKKGEKNTLQSFLSNHAPLFDDKHRWYHIVFKIKKKEKNKNWKEKSISIIESNL
jgi:hypothetical protein